MPGMVCLRPGLLGEQTGIVDAAGLRFRDRDEIPVVVLLPVGAVLGRGDAPACRALGPGDLAGRCQLPTATPSYMAA
jgi:hypothetical protein